MNKSYRPIIILALGSFLVSLLSLAIWIFVNGNQNEFAFGMITEVGESSFVISGRDNDESKILIDDDTFVVRGRENMPTDTLASGMFVQVEGILTLDGEILAQTIRLLQPPNDRRKPYEVQ